MFFSVKSAICCRLMAGSAAAVWTCAASRAAEGATAPAWATRSGTMRRLACMVFGLLLFGASLSCEAQAVCLSRGKGLHDDQTSACRHQLQACSTGSVPIKRQDKACSWLNVRSSRLLRYACFTHFGYLGSHRQVDPGSITGLHKCVQALRSSIGRARDLHSHRSTGERSELCTVSIRSQRPRSCAMDCKHGLLMRSARFERVASLINRACCRHAPS